MKPTTVFEVISAAHLTSHLSGVPAEFQQRGGIMLVAPPNSFKSTFVMAPLEHYPNALVLSDITTKQLIAARDDIAGRRYTTLGFPAFEKLYERDSDTAANIEGHLKGMVEEGFSHAAFEDQRMHRSEARCLVIAGVIPTVYRRKFTQWNDGGFLRRFLWCHYTLRDPYLITRAIHAWDPLTIGDGFALPGLPTGSIQFNVSEAESSELFAMLLNHQGGQGTPFVLLKKILSVLKWRYKHLGKEKASQRSMEILGDFAPSLSKEGAIIDINIPTSMPDLDVPMTPRRRNSQPTENQPRRKADITNGL